MYADFAIHDKNDGNPHAHIMLTMRPFNEDKTGGNKQKKEYILDKQGEKIYNKKTVPTNANLFRQPTGTTKAERKNGGARGLICAISFQSITTTPSG